MRGQKNKNAWGMFLHLAPSPGAGTPGSYAPQRAALVFPKTVHRACVDGTSDKPPFTAANTPGDNAPVMRRVTVCTLGGPGESGAPARGTPGAGECGSAAHLPISEAFSLIFNHL